MPTFETGNSTDANRNSGHLDHLVKNSKKSRKLLALARYLERIAQLDGYIARTSDPAPGKTVMWRGLRRLAEIQFDFHLASERYG